MKRLFLIAGPCAIEDENTAFLIAKQCKDICKDLDIDYVFKGSYRKANRSRLDTFQGIGDADALQIIQNIGNKLSIDTLTDIHESHEAAMAANFVTHLQIPAFLCRQTDLLLAAAHTGSTVNVKKGQFLSPESIGFAVEKIKSTGNHKVWLTERGTTFGYHDLIVDATSINRMKNHGVPVVMDCTHSVQKPNQQSGITGGDPALIESIALAAVATGADGLFFEVHPSPQEAQSDPHTMLQLDKLRSILEKCVKIRKALQ